MAVQHKAYQYRIYPTKEQQTFIAQSFGCSRFVFNHFLEKIKCADEEKRKTLQVNAFRNELKSMKTDYEWLKLVDSISLQASVENLNDAMVRFFKKQNRFPVFKSRKHPVKSYTTKSVNGNIKVTDTHIKLPKIGCIRYANSRYIPDSAVIKYAVVRQNAAGKYFVAINVKEHVDKTNKSHQTIGLDMGGLTDFVIDSNGNKINNERYFHSSEKKLAKAQRSLSRKQKFSNNWYKQKKKIAILHEKIVNNRKDFQHKLSSKLVQHYDVIAIEDLCVSDMLKDKTYSKSIQDASWSEFITMLAYKCDWYGKELVKVGKHFPSTQICSTCGTKHPITKDPSIRSWTCPTCHTSHDRDVNAALNIHKEGLRLLTVGAMGGIA
ncbi:mobile element protein [Gracilibacillus boraciitolerans JCM 21714]|uniref:Mobile element protein n=1 Tax=Gracilibacillus boraciitolerans JCM 21714 TaxID=1298598 RepID=W4VI88_9BACI|nr:IS200/IS605 family element RNA-guided endonuclease TnpB [Gracilibacillus boraciitolerans]GAE93125.1 mobile element protein [Gracilibacillus boraciitolerans JCM 21714]